MRSGVTWWYILIGMIRNINFPDIINIVAISQLLFFTLLLTIKQAGKSRSSKLLLTFLILQVLSYGNYFIYRFGMPDFQWIYLVTVPAAFIVTPVYYKYIETWLFKDSRSSRLLWVHLLPGLLSLILVFLDLQQGSIKVLPIAWLSEFPVFNTVQHFQILCYNIAALFLLKRYKIQRDNYYSSGNLGNTGWIEFLVYSYISAASIIGVIEIIFPLDTIINFSYIIFWIFLNIIFLKALIMPVESVRVEQTLQVQSVVPDNLITTVYPAIQKAMEEDKLFLKPELTLGDLSQCFNMPERIISQIIKQKTGFHFSAFVNNYRIEYSRSRLVSPDARQLTILEILYESGYNSKSVFNHQFKKFTGKSPTQYRANFSVLQNGKNSPDS